MELAHVSHKGEVCMEGRVFYAIDRKPPDAGHGGKDAYVDGRGGLCARYCAKCVQGAAGASASSPTSQFQGLRLFLSVISYRKCNFFGNGRFACIFEVGAIRGAYLRSAAFYFREMDW